MPSNKPDSRKTHITRIFGTNKNGERLEDIWVDVERIDVIKSSTQVPPKLQWQGVRRKFLWCDDPNDSATYKEEGTPSRNSKIMKICSPDETDLDDPDEWVPVRVIKKSRMVDATGHDVNNVKSEDKFLNEITAQQLAGSRVTEVRRIPHYDTSMDDVVDAAAKADPSLKSYVITSDEYTKDLESKDADQYVTHEIVKKIHPKGNTTAGGVSGMGRETKFQNQYLIDESDELKGDEVTGVTEVNPPYRLDPYQNIVNVNLGNLAVKFYKKESFAKLATKVPDNKKFVLSLWFRVPQKSLDAAKAEALAAPAGVRNPLLGIVPIKVWGMPTKRKKFVSGDDSPDVRTVGSTHFQFWSWDCLDPSCTTVGWRFLNGVESPEQPAIAHYPQFTGATEDADPSYIGIDCNGDYPQLSINIVMPRDNSAEFEGGDAWQFPVSVSAPDLGEYFDSAPGSPQAAAGTYLNPTSGVQSELFSGGPLGSVSNSVSIVTDTTAPIILGANCETYCTVPAARTGYSPDRADASYKGQRVEGGRWHHILLSGDFSSQVETKGEFIVETAISEPHGPDVGTYTILSGGQAGDTPVGQRCSKVNKLYLAFDDVNLTKEKLSAYYPTGHNDPNAIIPVNALNVAMDTAFDVHTRSAIWGSRIYDAVVKGKRGKYTFTPASIPFSAGDGFGFPATGHYIDAIKEVELGEYQLWLGDDAVVDFKQEINRRPFITDVGKPASLSKAKEFMGRRPDVLVHGSQNWKHAKDTGAIAARIKPIPDGEHAGRIETYKPNPNLKGDQGTD